MQKFRLAQMSGRPLSPRGAAEHDPMQKLFSSAMLVALLAGLPAIAQQPPAETPVSASATPGLSVDTGIKTLLAAPKAKDVIAKYARTVVEFFVSGQAEGLVPAEIPLTALAKNPMAIDASLNAENMQKISAELAAR